MNPDRPASSLLITQVEQMHMAEKRLPLRYRTDIYVNAIRTELEASRYIREVTEAIHSAHADAASLRIKRTPKRTRILQIAAAADEKHAGVKARKGVRKGKNTRTRSKK
jgi:hypothetical protein